MKRSMIQWSSGVIVILSGAAAQAGIMTFTLANNSQNVTPLPSSYQPLSGITATYTNISTYNGAADHTNPGAGTNTTNYFVFPSSGNNGVMTFAFSTDVNVPSFYYDNFHATGTIVVHAFNAASTELTPAGGLVLPSPSHPDSAPVFAQSTGLSAYNTIRSLTFTNTGADAVNIDDITVNAVPEPSAFVLCGLGVIGLLLASRRSLRS